MAFRGAGHEFWHEPDDGWPVLGAGAVCGGVGICPQYVPEASAWFPNGN